VSQPLRVAKRCGSHGAADEMAEGGPIDVLGGDHRHPTGAAREQVR
jgi:hypothetical protein